MGVGEILFEKSIKLKILSSSLHLIIYTTPHTQERSDDNIPPGTYTVTNAVTQQSKVYAVSKSCLVANRSDIGNATKFLISRQGLTFPVNWDAVISVEAVSSC